MENENSKVSDKGGRYSFTAFILDFYPSIACSSIPKDRRESFQEDHFNGKGEIKREWREYMNDYLFNIASSNPRVFSMLMDAYNLYLYTEINGNSVL